MWFGLGVNVPSVDYLRLTGSSDPILFSPQAVIQEGLVEANWSAYKSEKTERQDDSLLIKALTNRS